MKVRIAALFALATAAVVASAAPIVPKPGSNAGYLFFPALATSAANADDGLVQCAAAPTIGDTTLDMSVQDWNLTTKPLTVTYSMVGGSGGSGPGAGGGGSSAIVKNGVVVAIANGGDGGQTGSTASGTFSLSKTDTIRFVVGGGGGGGALLKSGASYDDYSGTVTTSAVEYIRGGGGGAGYRGGGSGGSPVTKFSSSVTGSAPVLVAATASEIAASMGTGGSAVNGTGGGTISRLSSYFSSGPGSGGSGINGGRPSWCATCGGSALGGNAPLLQGSQTSGNPWSFTTTIDQYLGGIGGAIGGAGAPLRLIETMNYGWSNGYIVSGTAITSASNQARYSYTRVTPFGYWGATPQGSEISCGASIQASITQVDLTSANLRTGCGAGSYDYPTGQASFALSSFARNLGNAGQIVLLYKGGTCQIIPSAK